MAELVKNQEQKMVVLYNEIIKDGQGVEPIIYEGNQVGIMGYASAADREAQLQMLQSALDQNDGDIMSAVTELSRVAQAVANDVTPSEEIDVTAEAGDLVAQAKIVIDYKARKAYKISATETQEVANLDGIDAKMPNEAIKELLLRDVKSYLIQEAAEAQADAESDEDEDTAGVMSGLLEALGL